ncbi:MAG: PHP domain-containing protein [Phycisphaerae bacterium]
MSDPRRWADLHMHSTASDGVYAPAHLMRLAARRGLSAVALTDHDTVAGLDEACRAAADAGIEFLTGVELACTMAGRMIHLLGYGFDSNDAALNASLQRIRSWRDERNRAILKRLSEIGKPLDSADYRAANGHAVGRPHIARAMVKAGYVRDERAAFAQYLGQGAAAFVPRQTLSAADGLTLIRQAGGRTSLAHPGQILFESPPQRDTVIGRLVDLGLDAIEIYHPSHDDHQTRRFLELTGRYGLAITGGSDFHGSAGAAPPPVAVGFSSLRVPYDVIRLVLARGDFAKSA